MILLTLVAASALAAAPELDSAPEVGVPFACGRFRVRKALFALTLPPRFLAAGFRFGARVALVARRAGRLAPCAAFPLGALRFALAEDFLAGLDFVAMVFLNWRTPLGTRWFIPLSQHGGGLGKPQIITCA